MVERKILWVFEIYSFLECIAGGKLMEKYQLLMSMDDTNETVEQKTLRIEEAEFCRYNANGNIIRAIKVCATNFPVLVFVLIFLYFFLYYITIDSRSF